MPDNSNATHTSRRRFLRGAAAATAVWPLAGSPGPILADAPKSVSFGLVTDVHYATKEAKGTRHYGDSLEKLNQAVTHFRRQKVDFLVELGDFVDGGVPKARELEFLQAANQVFSRFEGPRHYVLGNHCLGAFTKKEFLGHCGSTRKRGYYSFDHGPMHFVVLDAGFLADGTPYAAGNFTWTDTWIPKEEQTWLANDLARAGDRPTILFLHQNLHDETDAHGVKNAPDVRSILEKAGNVKAVFQGHMHVGGHEKIEGIHYCTLKAMVEGPGVENNAYAQVTVDAAGVIRLQGSGRQDDVVLDS